MTNEKKGKQHCTLISVSAILNGSMPKKVNAHYIVQYSTCTASPRISYFANTHVTNDSTYHYNFSASFRIYSDSTQYINRRKSRDFPPTFPSELRFTFPLSNTWCTLFKEIHSLCIMVPSVADNPVIMEEHAYYDRFVDEPSSEGGDGWVFVFACVFAIFSASKFAHAFYKKYSKKTLRLLEEMV